MIYDFIINKIINKSDLTCASIYVCVTVVGQLQVQLSEAPVQSLSGCSDAGTEAAVLRQNEQMLRVSAEQLSDDVTDTGTHTHRDTAGKLDYMDIAVRSLVGWLHTEMVTHPMPSHSSHSLPSSPFPLELGPCNPARGSGRAM